MRFFWIIWGVYSVFSPQQIEAIPYRLPSQPEKTTYHIIIQGQPVGRLTIATHHTPASKGAHPQLVTALEQEVQFQRAGYPFSSHAATEYLEEYRSEQHARSQHPTLNAKQFHHTFTLSDQATISANGIITTDHQLHTTVQQYMDTQTADHPLQAEQFYFPTGERIKQLFAALAKQPVGTTASYQTLQLVLAPQLVNATATYLGKTSIQIAERLYPKVYQFEITSPQSTSNPYRSLEYRDANGKLLKAEIRSTVESSATAQTRIEIASASQKDSFEDGFQLAAIPTADTLFKTRIRPDQAILNPRQLKTARYQISWQNPTQENLPFPEDLRQRILKRQPGRLTLSITQREPAQPLAPFPIAKTALTEPVYLASSQAIQANDPQIQQVAKQVVGTEKRAYFAAKALQNWVYEHIQQKDLSTGFASASETLSSRQGDCTEHAVLLAALARSLGIPARVAVGLAYFPERNQATGYFIYHMWTEVFIWDPATDKQFGEWVALDATQGNTVQSIPTVDATHIKLLDSSLSEPNDLLTLSNQLAPFLGDSLSSPISNGFQLSVLQAESDGKTVIGLEKKSPTEALPPSSTETITSINLNQQEIQRSTQQQMPWFSLKDNTILPGVEGYQTAFVEALLAGKIDTALQAVENAIAHAKTPAQQYFLSRQLVNWHWYEPARGLLAQLKQSWPETTASLTAWEQEYFPNERLSAEASTEWLSLLSQLFQAQQQATRKPSTETPTLWEAFETFRAEHPSYTPLYLEGATLAKRQGNLELAKSLYQALQQQHPEDPRSTFGLANLAYSQKHYPQAAQTFQQTLTRLKGRQSLPSQLLRRESKALLSIAQGQAIRRQQPTKGQLLIAKGNLDKHLIASAIQALEAVQRSAPKSREAAEAASIELGIALQFANQEEIPDLLELIQSRQKAGLPALNTNLTRFLTGYQQMRSRQYPLAEKTYRNLLNSPYENIQSLGFQALSTLYQRQGKETQAIQILNQGLSKLTQSTERLELEEKLAGLLRHQAPQQAAPIITEVLSKRPLRWQAHLIQGRIQMQLGELDRAEQSLITALLLQADQPDILSTLGDLYALQSNPNEAMAYYKQALQQRPGNPAAISGLTLLIDQYQLPLSKPQHTISLSDDETDYFISLLKLDWQMGQTTGAFWHAFSQSVRSHRSNIGAGFSASIPTYDEGYQNILKIYQQAQHITPPQRFAQLHEHFSNYIYGQLATIKYQRDWVVSHPMTPDLRPLGKDEQYRAITSEAMTAANAYQSSSITLLKNLAPSTVQRLTLESGLPIAEKLNTFLK